MVSQEIIMIYAATKTGVIGNSATNSMPWPRLKKDMQFFKETTMGGTIILGRKTFESIGKVLPGRENIVITRQEKNRATYLAFAGCKVANSLGEALAMSTKDKVFIIGGAEIYKLAMSCVRKIYQTTIKQDYSGDIYIEPLSSYWLATTLYEDDQLLIEELNKV
jgi:dihydrofolate reductase